MSGLVALPSRSVLFNYQKRKRLGTGRSPMKYCDFYFEIREI